MNASKSISLNYKKYYRSATEVISHKDPFPFYAMSLSFFGYFRLKKTYRKNAYYIVFLITKITG